MYNIKFWHNLIKFDKNRKKCSEKFRYTKMTKEIRIKSSNLLIYQIRKLKERITESDIVGTVYHLAILHM